MIIAIKTAPAGVILSHGGHAVDVQVVSDAFQKMQLQLSELSGQVGALSAQRPASGDRGGRGDRGRGNRGRGGRGRGGGGAFGGGDDEPSDF